MAFICAAVALTVIATGSGCASLALARPAQGPGAPAAAVRADGAVPSAAGAAATSAVPARPIGAGTSAAGATATGGPAGTPFTGGDAFAAAPPSGGDALASNGFDSALCRDRAVRAELSSTAQANCETSNFVATAAPSGNYAFDIHMDTGVGAIGGNAVPVLVQDILLTPAWTALVWITHALVVALEWCYSIELLNGSTLAVIGDALRSSQANLTQPWLVVVLAIASVLVLYHGVVRRRVAESLGEFCLMVAMMATGLWVIADPAGTVGAVAHLANQASLSTVGAVAQGDPRRPQRALADGVGEIFATAIGGPWCFLEFGDIDWCRRPGRLDARLRLAASHLQASKRSSPDPQQRTSALLLSRASTNGDLFLALAANQVDRNSINTQGSLLRVLCASSDVTRCTGPTAAQAEFRTASGTWTRAGGLLLIVIGAFGMFALLGYLALRLIGAAVASLFLLLLAPVAVLAPALGEAGRAAFRTWAMRLLGAVLSKLLYSIFLGVVLLILGVLHRLGSLGWWTQWLLVAAMWWTLFAQRENLMRLSSLGERPHRTPGLRVTSALMAGRELGRLAGAVRGGLARRRPPIDPGGGTKRDKDSKRTEASDDAHRRGQVEKLRTAAGGGEPRAQVSARTVSARERIARVARERRRAQAAGDTRRAASLSAREQRLGAALAQDETTLAATPSQADASGRRRHEWERKQREQLDQLLDRQSALPPARERLAPGGSRRDYGALGGLAGLRPGAYEDLAPDRQRAVRLAIDRELDLRRDTTAQKAAGHQAPTQRSAADAPAATSARPATPGSGAPRSPQPDRPRPRGTSAAGRQESPALRRERQFERRPDAVVPRVKARGAQGPERRS